MIKLGILLSTLLLFVICGLNEVTYAEETFVDKFVGSPLLILAGLLVVVAVAVVYHKIQK